MNYWLMKSEPDVFSYADLVKKGKAEWDGVRNHAAQLHMKAMRKGDLAFFYHSNIGVEAVGIMEGRVSEVVEIVWRRNLRVNQHPPNRRLQPPGRSRHEAEYRQLVLFATARRRGV